MISARDDAVINLYVLLVSQFAHHFVYFINRDNAVLVALHDEARRRTW